MEYSGNESLEHTPEVYEGGLEESSEKHKPEGVAEDLSAWMTCNSQEFTEEDNPEHVHEGFDDSEVLQQSSFFTESPMSPPVKDTTHSHSSDEEDDSVKFDQFLSHMREAIDLVSTCTKPAKAER